MIVEQRRIKQLLGIGFVLVGIISGFYCSILGMRLAYLVGGIRIKYYRPQIAVTIDSEYILGPAVASFLVLAWFPAMALLLVVLPTVVSNRYKWIAAYVCVSQIVAARTFAFVSSYFRHYRDDLRVVDTFAEIRQEMTALERWIYSPLVDLLERGWGYWAIALHSIVLGAFWTLVVYGVYRLIRGAVQRRRSAEPAPRGETA